VLQGQLALQAQPVRKALLDRLVQQVLLALLVLLELQVQQVLLVLEEILVLLEQQVLLVQQVHKV
jgi:hypothetical protein